MFPTRRRLLGMLCAIVLASAPVLAQRHRHDSEEALTALVKALDLREGSVVADVGAGQGNYSIPMAKTVGATGRVIAVDINARVLDRLRERAERESFSNVTTTVGATDDPKLAPASIDAALIVNAYHEMTAYPAMLAHIRTALKPSGRLVIADFVSPSRRTQARDQQTGRHEIAPELVLTDLRAAGFRIVALEDPFTASGHDDSNHVEWIVVATPAVEQ